MKEILHPYPCVVDELKWKLTVVHGDYPENRKAVECDAIWDTGASNTTVDVRLAKALGLKRLNLPPRVSNTGNGCILSYAYEANLKLSPEWPLQKVVVYDMPPSDMPVLIGMDIIGQGVFQTWPQDGRTMLRFVMP